MPAKQRNSSIELLRILIMYMILLVHTNYFVFGGPEDHSMTSFMRCLAEAFTLMPVEIFMLITGYFGTRFSVTKVAGLIYQMIFCVMVITAVYVLLGKGGNRMYDFMFWGYWFVNAYIGVVIFSPIVNVAIEKISKRQFELFLISFYVIFGIGEYACGLFGGGLLKGYSIIWFLYMYMFGRYLRMYTPKISTAWLLVVFIGSLMASTLLLFTTLGYADFVNPFMILQSASFLLLFTRFNFKSKTVNYIASSTLMVYLVSMHPCYAETFKEHIRAMYDPSGSTVLFILKILAYCAAVFAVSIAFDKLRQLTWKPLSRPFQKLDSLLP